jgi:hypothetical protein
MGTGAATWRSGIETFGAASTLLAALASLLVQFLASVLPLQLTRRKKRNVGLAERDLHGSRLHGFCEVPVLTRVSPGSSSDAGSVAGLTSASRTVQPTPRRGGSGGVENALQYGLADEGPEGARFRNFAYIPLAWPIRKSKAMGSGVRVICPQLAATTPKAGLASTRLSTCRRPKRQAFGPQLPFGRLQRGYAKAGAHCRPGRAHHRDCPEVFQRPADTLTRRSAVPAGVTNQRGDAQAGISFCPRT